ncbi:MAG: Nitrite reductase small subunit [Pseudomonadota bacterium]|jgi:nitrite reductase (NADH) small subunit
MSDKWITVGKTQDLIADAGVGAQVGEQQVAVFFIRQTNALYAVSNFCPVNKANIIARGIVGDINGEPVVASPLYKEHFSLLTGKCLEQPALALEVWSVRLHGDEVQVQKAA